MSAFRISGEQILYTRNSNFWVPLLCIILNTWSRVCLLNEKHVLHYGFGFEKKKKFHWYMFVFQQTTSIFFWLKQGLSCTFNLVVLHSFFKNLCLNQLLTMFAKPFSTQCRYWTWWYLFFEHILESSGDITLPSETVGVSYRWP